MAPSLTITAPTEGATVERGGQLTVTWEGVLIPQVLILLAAPSSSDATANANANTTRALAVMANTGHYHWTAPLAADAVGEYDLIIQAVEAGNREADAAAAAATAPIAVARVRIAVVDPPPAPAASLEVTAPLMPATWTEGDVITVTYASQGVAGPVRVEAHSLSLGPLFNVTAEGPTSGSVSFVALPPPADPVRDAYLLLRTGNQGDGEEQISARTGLVTYYPRRRLSQVALPAATLYKGAQYEVTWRAAGEPFPVAVMLYSGTAERVTEAGRPCVPWRDAAGQNYTGCVLSYDLVNEVCATAVDAEGRLLEAGQCKPATAAAALVLTAAGGEGAGDAALLSSAGRATLALPAASTELPVPGASYTVVVAAAAAGTKAAARSPPFAIAAPAARLDFGVLLDALAATPVAGLAATTESLADLVADFLAAALRVERPRVSVQPLAAERGAGHKFRVRAAIAPAPDATRVSAAAAGEAFVRGWRNRNLSAPVPAGLAAVGFRLDDAVPPALSLVGPEDAAAAASSHDDAPRRSLAADPTGTMAAVHTLLQSQSPRVVVVGSVAASVMLMAVMGLFIVRRLRAGRGFLLSSGADLRVHDAGSVASHALAPAPGSSPSTRV